MDNFFIFKFFYWSSLNVLKDFGDFCFNISIICFFVQTAFRFYFVFNGIKSHFNIFKVSLCTGEFNCDVLIAIFFKKNIRDLFYPFLKSLVADIQGTILFRMLAINCNFSCQQIRIVLD